MLQFKRWRRRFPKLQWFLVTAIFINIIIYYWLVRGEPNYTHERLSNSKHKTHHRSAADLRSKTDGSVTIVIADFEEFDNRVAETVRKAKQVMPRADVVVVSHDLPYPALNISDVAELVILTPSLNGSMLDGRPDSYITSEYIVFLPDACEIISEGSLQIMIDTLYGAPDVQMVAWPATPDRDVKCLGLDADLKHWTLKYSKSEGLCDALKGNFVFIIRHKHLFQLPVPFQKPFITAFFIQTALKGWKIKLFTDFTYRKIDRLFANGHYLWKHQSNELSRTKNLYKDFGVKVVKHEDGAQEWYGCHKTTERCFPSINHGNPDYIHRGRYTPPCCLKGMKKTAIHVFSILQAYGVRYWLEGGSLLGAARNGDIIPWDYDVDIGIYKEDIVKCSHLMKVGKSSYEDDQGFVWERAQDGDFYRVQFSRTNRLHVDIFPFYSKHGNMTKDTWFKDHPQDMPFPEHFLKPLSTIPFIGVQASAPNNHRQFLELKYGKGVIENPKYPKPVKFYGLR